MILPRRLMTFTDKAGKVCFCEEDDPRQEMNYRPKGYPIPDIEAERIGLKAYFDANGWGDVADTPEMKDEAKPPAAKAVAQAEVEDKAIDGPEPKPHVGLSVTSSSGDMAAVADEPKGDEMPGLHIDTESRRGRRGA